MDRVGSIEFSVHNNLTEVTNEVGHTKSYEENKLLFWVMVVLYTCFGLLAAVGNGLVLYVAYKGRDDSRLKYLGPLIKSLAVTDLLFGLIGTPMLIVFYFIRKLYYITSNIIRKILHRV